MKARVPTMIARRRAAEGPLRGRRDRGGVRLPRVAARRQLRLPRLPGVRPAAKAAGDCVPGRGTRHPRADAPLPLHDARCRSRDRAGPARAPARRQPPRRLEDEPVRDRAPARPDGRHHGQARRAQGNTVALRLLGLFTRKAYIEPASKIPILARKLRQIVVAEDYLEGSHDYKTLVELFESFPKDELFAASSEELRQTLVRLLDLQERRGIQLFIRRDSTRSGSRVLVALPRDRFNAELRQRLQESVPRALRRLVDRLPPLARRRAAGAHPLHGPRRRPDPRGLVRRARAGGRVASRPHLGRPAARAARRPARGGAGRRARREVRARFPDYYKASTDVYLARARHRAVRALDAGEPFVVGLQNERGQEQNLTRIGLYKTAGRSGCRTSCPSSRHLGLAVSRRFRRV